MILELTLADCFDDTAGSEQPTRCGGDHNLAFARFRLQSRGEVGRGADNGMFLR